MSTNPRLINFAYVGCGFVAQTIHIPNFAALPNCRFLGLAEVRADLGQQVARHYGIPKVYPSHEEIAADPEIEAVGVSGPYSLQGKIAEDLLRAGKHVFMEKPMAVSLRRAEAIVASQAQSKGRLMVAYMKRYDAGNLLLKRHLDEWRASGEFGKPKLARNHGFGGDWIYALDQNVPVYSSPAPMPGAPDEIPDWLPGKYKDSYLGFLQQWTHNINLLRFFLEKTPGETRLVQTDLSADGMTGITVFDIGGVRAVLESGYARSHAWDEHTQIYFEGGWLKTQAPPLMQKEMSATVEIYRGPREGHLPSHAEEFAPPSWSYREEAKHFLESIANNTPFRSSAEDTLHDVRLYEEIYRQYTAK